MSNLSPSHNNRTGMLSRLLGQTLVKLEVLLFKKSQINRAMALCSCNRRKTQGSMLKMSVMLIGFV